MAITCGNTTHSDKTRHATVDAVRACFAGTLTVCTWLLQEWIEDGYHTYECGADQWPLYDTATGREIGYECASGHDHFDMQYLAEKGAAYMDEEEAQGYWQAVRNGEILPGIKTTILMDGKVYVP